MKDGFQLLILLSVERMLCMRWKNLVVVSKNADIGHGLFRRVDDRIVGMLGVGQVPEYVIDGLAELGLVSGSSGVPSSLDRVVVLGVAKKLVGVVDGGVVLSKNIPNPQLRAIFVRQNGQI